MHLLQVNTDFYCVKLIQFHDNYRPAYFGAANRQALRARASSFCLRRFPFAKYPTLCYEVDSDEEWEEEELEGVEIIDSSECSSDAGESLAMPGALEEDDDFLATDEEEEPKILKKKIQILPPVLLPGTKELGIFLVHWHTPQMPTDPWASVEEPASEKALAFPEALVGQLGEIISAAAATLGTCSMKELYREFIAKTNSKVSKRAFGEKMREIALYVQNRWTLKSSLEKASMEIGLNECTRTEVTEGTRMVIEVDECVRTE
jgi:hypothetical protein